MTSEPAPIAESVRPAPLIQRIQEMLFKETSDPYKEGWNDALYNLWDAIEDSLATGGIVDPATAPRFHE